MRAIRIIPAVIALLLLTYLAGVVLLLKDLSRMMCVEN